jgi:hypothetical protein
LVSYLAGTEDVGPRWPNNIRAGRDCGISPLPMTRQAIALRRPLRRRFGFARIS